MFRTLLFLAVPLATSFGAVAQSQLQVLAWGVTEGHLYHGQTNVPDDLEGAVQVSAGFTHSLALLEDGTVRGWGSNTYGKLDFPSDLDEVVQVEGGVIHTVVLRADGTVYSWGSGAVTNVPPFLQDPATANADRLAAGERHTLALLDDGNVVAWGHGFSGEMDIPDDLEEVVQVAVGATTSFALQANGVVRAWGWEGAAALQVPSALQSPETSGAVQISAGFDHVVALIDDGTVVVWGSNARGQLNMPAGLSNVTQVSAGNWHSLALRDDGTIVAWGIDSGASHTGQTHVPFDLAGVTHVSAGGYHSLALVARGGPTSTEPGAHPPALTVDPNFPNPFRGKTDIGFTLPYPTDVRVVVYDVLGRQVGVLMNQHLEAGSHSVTWRGTDDGDRSLPAGIYLYRVEASGTSVSRAMTLVR